MERKKWDGTSISPFVAAAFKVNSSATADRATEFLRDTGSHVVVVVRGAAMRAAGQELEGLKVIAYSASRKILRDSLH